MAAVPNADEAVVSVYDADDNGVIDAADADFDGNGVVDGYLYDFNEDGQWDGVDTDADEDGYAETFEVDEDYNGTIDRIEHYDATGDLVGSEVDTDSDGVIDQIATDSDGDGAMDTFEYDTDGDGEIDEVNEVDDPYEGQGGVYGETEDQYYQFQEVNGLCGPTSAAIIISEQLGEEVAFEDVSQTAVDLGLMYEMEDGTYNGTFAQGMVDIFDAYGVDTTVEYGDLSMLEGFLADGRDVMVALDASEIWGSGEDTPWANHYLVVTQVDEERGVVTLNDPGQAGGASFEVPLETFVDAWADGSNQMIVTEDAGVGYESSDDAEDSDESEDSDGFDVQDLEDLFDVDLSDGTVDGAEDSILDQIFDLVA